ncbi:hypothetical protein Tsubulata_043327 [Turnera subulata]|uniref:Late embryogenesis abundant protein LEA-2 subgroup domain-containing protein n=1 Tax=Turnera subulata TaxID=218843 RepID=A0A9Q0JCN4_9ROSI|nr:hypothetical protein Tsubulata_043327 [Turnera subulata]
MELNHQNPTQKSSISFLAKTLHTVYSSRSLHTHQPHPPPPPPMSLSKTEPPPPPPSPTHYYTHLPSQPEQGFILLPFCNCNNPLTDPIRRRRRWPTISALILLPILILSGLAYLLWPSDPTLQVVRLRLDKIRVHTIPIISLDISMHVTIRVRNVDVYSMDLNTLDVAVKYRGKRLGHVTSGRGHVRAFASSYVEAELNLIGVRVLTDVVPLLEDLAKGSVPFDTVTEVSGRLGLLFFGFPLKAKLSCEVLVNTKNQTILRQSCLPEALSSNNLIQPTIISLDQPVDGQLLMITNRTI